MKNIYLLGATGSIGLQTIEIIENNPDDFRLVAISGYENVDKLVEIASNFQVELIAAKDENDAFFLKNAFPDITVVFGETGLVELAKFNAEDKNSLLINALVGMVGLRPTVAAIKIDRDILLANKETLVVGGHLIKNLLKEHPVKLYPLDSEHNAIWQILNGEDPKNIKKIILTASGGPFRDLSRLDLKNVTLKAALNHPNWSMGQKITIDSATMMNKGFEMIEAAYLFNIDIDMIEPIIHPESIIHSMVEFKDNSIIAQLANHDMRLPISYAMYYPKRVQNVTQALNLAEIGSLNFRKVDFEQYPLLQLAIDCFNKGGSARTVLNAANEAAVHLFLNKKIDFLDIEKIVKYAVQEHFEILNPSLDEIYRIDQETKNQIYSEYDI